jgi:Fic-DOC domain mobile mystery protein B
VPDWQSIPGETPIDPSGLKVKGVTNRAELSVFEAKNVLKATTKYLASKPTRKIAPFNLAWVQRLHGEMFGDVWKWAGKIRTEDLSIGMSHWAIRDNLVSLLDDVHAWPDLGMDIIEQSARLHYRAVGIHPFMNGNGRWSRMLANIWLRLNGHPAVDWPEATIGTESVIRKEYIAAIVKGVDGELEPLIEMHRHYAAKSK